MVQKRKRAPADQIDYARGIGFNVSEDISHDELSTLLTDFQEIREFAEKVWVNLTGKTLDQDRITGESRDLAVMRIYKNGRLRAKVLAWEKRLEALQESPEDSTEASAPSVSALEGYDQVEAILTKTFKPGGCLKGLFGLLALLLLGLGFG
ncbi:MAG: hypothetical protein ACYTHN_21150 [Planctomycetota bacterium]